MVRRFFTAISVLTVSLLISGCAFDPFGAFGSSGDLGPAGIWISLNQGDIWRSANTLMSPTGNQSLEGVGVFGLAQDPADKNTWYATAGATGLLYSYANGAAWQGTLSGLGFVRTVWIDAKNKCTLYAGLDNKVVKTIDCGRSWAPMYVDARNNVQVVGIVTDPKYQNTVYAAMSGGDILRSLDGGLTWSPVFRFQDILTGMKIGQAQGTLYVASVSNGLWRSADDGQTWTNFKDLTTALLPDAGNIDRFFVGRDENSFVLQTKTGILRSDDAGKTWRRLTLITPREQTFIQVSAVFPGNFDQIYYVMGTTLYRSLDGGKNWKTLSLPSRRPVTAMTVDYSNASTVLLGFGL